MMERSGDSNANWEAVYRLLVKDKSQRNPISMKRIDKGFLLEDFMKRCGDITTKYVWNVYWPYIVGGKKPAPVDESLDVERLFIWNKLEARLRVGNPNVYNPMFSGANPSEFDVLIHENGMTLVSNVKDFDGGGLFFYHYNLDKVVLLGGDNVFRTGRE